MIGYIGRSNRRAGFVGGLLFALALLMSMAASAPAWAHASLTLAKPADGAVVASSPERFSLTFSEPVSPLALKLVGPDGVSQPLDDYVERDNTLDIASPEKLGQGTYMLSWRVVSGDGHPIGGALAFSIGAPSASPPELVEEVDWPLRAAVWGARIALYLGLFFGIGGVFISAWIVKDGQPRTTRALLVLGLLAVPLSTGFQGLDALAAPLNGLLHPAIWKAGFDTSFGRTAVIAAVAFAAALAATMTAGMAARLLALLSLAGAGAALAASGHAGAAEPQWLTRPMVFLHATGIAFWAGALMPLGIALKRRAPDAFDGLRRFSKTIPYVVATLLIAGVVLAVMQVEAPSALVETAYGRVLLVKLALLAALFVLAVVNRWKLAAPAERADRQATRSLVRSIAAETLLMILIFAVAAAWRFTPPPRVLAIEAARPASIHIGQADAMVDMTVTPGRAGPVEVSMVIMTGDFGPLDARGVTMALNSPGLEPVVRKAFKPGDGTWRIDGFPIPAAGDWTVRVDIQISDTQVATLNGLIDIRP